DALGVASTRAAVFAVRTARALAAAVGRDAPVDTDLAGAVQLVLAPRATRVPSPAPPPGNEPAPPPDATGPPPDASGHDEREQHDDTTTPPGSPDSRHDDIGMRELLIEAARAALPRDLVADATGGPATRSAPSRGPAGRAAHGQRHTDDRRGRRVGTRPGHPRDGARLDLVETLRTAAPWQAVRGRTPSGPLAVRTGDLRVERRHRPLGTTTIVVVDASGSAALGRLAEAKGAAELLLAESYARRDHVALVAFRGTEASVLLPPTRALARARRVVSALPAGGGTPLAAALVVATDLARTVRRGGARPAVVLLTDGRANIALDGTPGRTAARTDAQAAARALAAAIDAAGGLTVVVDTAVRGGPDGRELATAAGARYLALPHVSAQTLHGAIQAAIGGDEVAHTAGPARAEAPRAEAPRAEAPRAGVLRA
ncbi:MAG TPA: VWA domain-containing protein, partial [Gemmatirosa sp.]